MDVDDYYQNGKRWWFRLHEKGGKRHEVPAHHTAEEYLDAYLAAAGIADQPKGSPLPHHRPHDRTLTSSRLHRTDALRMIKRRAKAAGLPASTCCHTFRATGITAYLQNGGTIENAQQIAGARVSAHHQALRPDERCHHARRGREDCDLNPVR